MGSIINLLCVKALTGGKYAIPNLLLHTIRGEAILAMMKLKSACYPIKKSDGLRIQSQL